MRDIFKTLLVITGIIVLLFLLLVGFNVWAYTSAENTLSTAPAGSAMAVSA
jgi:hypothetical protein